MKIVALKFRHLCPMCIFSFLQGSSKIGTKGYFKADLWATQNAAASHIGL
jgi:hypothetical protein